MKVRVLFFAQLRDAFRKGECYIEIEKGVTVGKLVHSLFQNEALESLRSLPILYAVNEDIAKENRVLQDDDVVALLPPVAGG